MMYLSRQEREERAQSQRREQGFRNSPMRNTLPNKSKQKLSVQRNPVAIFLNNAGLGRYAETLIGNGFDDMETLLDIEEEHMRQLGMPPGHIVKLKKRLRQMQETPTVDDATQQQVVQVTRSPASIRQPDCTANQMTTVQMSWVHVQNMGTDKVGEIFYKKFFKLRPESKDLFPLSVRARYRDWSSGVEEAEDDLDNSPALRKLWAKVIDAVGSAVAGLQDVSKLVPMLHRLGMRHHNYHMKTEYFEDAALVLIEVLKEGLGDNFTSEIEQAWVMVYSFMTATMIAGLRSAEAEVLGIQSRLSSSSKQVSECASETSILTEASKIPAGDTPEKPAKWCIEEDRESEFYSGHHVSLDTLQGLRGGA
eukprot:CAMPEP_0197640684 /NCGR_PEP_ID=MMETSP1338-20131121/14888_1 /TAXON_ID=43686 ORGANISM="Pelagodinium beii, Strain RCC1491" /NCGR_SAMPLE_ID=MMETSP1338 /ASSEMBLY_ACC=CAM_ASM_000754 /LENGTH=364 /DNA_ID=CAMNT_0043213555 /DNA_START=88 /DNA_END=1182 /DNA_ORIENTATION=-